jgi:Dolichyl-phosphate-mannose-protein mannosyltransferase
VQTNSNRLLNIWHVLNLALLVRVLLPISAYFYTHDATIFYTGDTAQYTAPARELIAHHSFFSDGSLEARVWNSPIAPAPDIIRTPGYPLLLTVGLLLGPLVPITVALQIWLSCFTVYIVYKSAGLIFESEKVALSAALLYAVEPLAVIFSSLLSTEAMFTAILMLGVYYLVRYLKGQSLTDLLVSAGALAASIYVCPAGYFLPLIIAAGLVMWTAMAGDQNSRMLIHLSAFLVVFLGLTGLWRIRNKVVTGY